MTDKVCKFSWYELMTSDIDAAERFYGSVVGWTGSEFGNNEMRYRVMSAEGLGIGGIMGIPEGAGFPPCWVGYIGVPDTDAGAEQVKSAGGSICKDPADIPEVGRFAVVTDPQGAMFHLITPNGPDMPELPRRTPGTVGWHELYTSDGKAAFDFYAGQFGWDEVRTMDMGPMGIYRIFGWHPDGDGGMMNHPQPGAPPAWLFYFCVEDIDAAAERVRDGGGEVLMGPMEVPDGSWVLQGNDPQGARFALVARTR
jgi:predicted enzyme related to lactoylglutathione lyase